MQLVVHNPPWTARIDHTPKDAMAHGHVTAKGDSHLRACATPVRGVNRGANIRRCTVAEKKGAAVNRRCETQQPRSPERQPVAHAHHPFPTAATNPVTPWSFCRGGGGGNNDA